MIRFTLNDIPLSDRSVRLLTAPIFQLMAEQCEKDRRELWQSTSMFWRLFGMRPVRKEHFIFNWDVS